MKKDTVLSFSDLLPSRVSPDSASTSFSYSFYASESLQEFTIPFIDLLIPFFLHAVPSA